MAQQPSATIDFSVVIALSEVRGDTVSFIRSWCEEQTYARDRFEVIVISDGSRPELDRAIEDVLGPKDRILQHPPAEEPALYHYGAEHASGTFLFMTECHCQGKADCLEQMHEFLVRTGLDGARCRAIGVGAEDWRIAIEWRLIQEGLREAGEQQSSWRNFVLHGIAIGRDTYFEAGGLDASLGLFAYSALGAKLQSSGKKLGYSPASVVYHLGCGAPEEVRPIAESIIRGEVQFRILNEASIGEVYFGTPKEWMARALYRPELARPLLQAILKSLPAALKQRHTSMSKGWAGILPSLVPGAVSGTRFSMLRASLFMGMAAALLSLFGSKSERSYRVYKAYIYHLMRRARLKAITVHMAGLDEDIAATNRYELAKIDENRVIGFYPVEAEIDLPFRWLEPAALLEVSLQPGRYAVQIEVARETTAPVHLMAYFDGHRLNQAEEDRLGFYLEHRAFTAQGNHTLILLSNCRPPDPAGGHNRIPSLGIRAIEFQPISTKEIVPTPSGAHA